MARRVLAAGGVVTRPATGGPEVLLVHRPRYDDWSLPKGKADPGESPAETARREILEETGCACAIGNEVAVVEYVDDRGRPKQVRYFAAVVEVEHPFVPDDEVDEIRWCPLPVALGLVTRAADRDVIVAAGAPEVPGAPHR